MMKTLFLLCRQYSKHLLREIIIIVQIIILVALVAPVASELLHLFSVNKLAKQFTKPAIYFQASSLYQISDNISEKDCTERFNQIEQHPLVNDVGYVAHGGFSYEDTGVTVVFYNNCLVDNIHLDIKEGSMINSNSEGNQISVLINEAMSDAFEVGEVIKIDELRFPVSLEYKNVEIIIAGIIKNNSYYYTMQGGASNTQLESIGGNPSSNEYIMIATTGFDIVPIKDILPSCMLFAEKINSNVTNQINNDLKKFGNASSIEEMRENSIKTIILENPLLFVAATMLLLLCCTSVCSYAFLSVINMRKKFSIYYICGLSWRKSLLITLSALTIILLVSFILAIIILPFTWYAVEFNGILIASLLIVFIYILSIFVAITKYKDIDPVALLKKGD